MLVGFDFEHPGRPKPSIKDYTLNDTGFLKMIEGFSLFSWKAMYLSMHIYTYIHTYIYIYMYTCACVFR